MRTILIQGIRYSGTVLRGIPDGTLTGPWWDLDDAMMLVEQQSRLERLEKKENGVMMEMEMEMEMACRVRESSCLQ